MPGTLHDKYSTYSLMGLDLFLALAGLIGVILFGLFLPAEHPDSAAAFEITEDEAITLASEYLATKGLDTEKLDAVASFNRREEVIQNLQHTLGRPGTVEFLSSDDGKLISAYFWGVRYFIPRDPDTSGMIEDAEVLFRVQLAQNGQVVDVRAESDRMDSLEHLYGSTNSFVDRGALAVVFQPDSSSNSEFQRTLTEFPDSVLKQSFYFDPTLSRRTASDSVFTRLREERSVSLDSVSVERLITYHLASTVYSGLAWTTKSLTPTSTSTSSVVRIELESSQPPGGQSVKLSAQISATGALKRLSVEYSQPETKASGIVRARKLVGVGLIALIIVIFIVAFFRRMIARLLDMKSAMIDAMIVGILGGGLTVVFILQNAQLDQVASIGGLILLYTLIFSFSAGGFAVAAFIVAGVTDSVVREHGTFRLRTMILLRHGDLVNRLTGASILRGSSVAGIILGISVLILVMFPGIVLQLDENLLQSTPVQPFAGVLFASFCVAYFYTLMWGVGVASTAHRWSKNSLLGVILLVLTGILLNVGPFSIQSNYDGLILTGLIALVLSLTYIRYDIFTVLIAFFLSSVLWKLSEGFLIQGSSMWVDVLLAGLLVVTLLALGVVGVLSNRTGQEADSYVPGYVVDMTTQERVKRELEIAQQVQTFFLPRKMPSIPGLDIAGMCLPATEVGGDYYDFVELDKGRMAFILGDVSGKGIEAAFYMTFVKGVIQTLSRQGFGAAEVMRKLNHLFCANSPNGTFISVIYGEFNPDDSSFTFARAGHNPAILWEAGKAEARALQPKGMAIGFTDGIRFDSNIEELKVTLAVGDTMVFYTDGFSEAMNRKRDLYGDDRLLRKVSQNGDKSSSALLRLLTEDVHHFIEGMGRSDDMTMVILTYIGRELAHE